MIRNEEILTFLTSNRDALQTRFSVRKIGLFGSVLHGTATEDSDVDILVDLSQPTFDNYMDLKFFLEDHIGRPVDLVLVDCVKPRLAPIIEREVVYA